MAELRVTLYDGKELIYAGRVEGEFDEEREFSKLCEQMKVSLHNDLMTWRNHRQELARG